MYTYKLVYLLTVNLHEVDVGHNRIWLTFFVWQQNGHNLLIVLF